MPIMIHNGFHCGTQLPHHGNLLLVVGQIDMFSHNRHVGRAAGTNPRDQLVIYRGSPHEVGVHHARTRGACHLSRVFDRGSCSRLRGLEEPAIIPRDAALRGAGANARKRIVVGRLPALLPPGNGRLRHSGDQGHLGLRDAEDLLTDVEERPRHA